MLGTPSAMLVLECLLFGLRFDISTVLLFNAPIILLLLIPLNYRNAAVVSKISNFLFWLINAPLIFLNLADIFVFPFVLGRMTVKDLFMAHTHENFLQLLPGIFRTYWYGFLLFIVVIYGLSKIYSFTIKKHEHQSRLLQEGAFLILFAALFIIGVRGGVQKIPITAINANAMIGGNTLAPAVLNTPFSIIQSLNQPPLQQDLSITFEEAEKNYPCEHHYTSNEPMKKLNVVVIILESFSAEYIGALNNGVGFTPFLDSLAKQSLLFTNCYANGKISIEGIPSILSSLPSYNDQPVLSSVYAANRINSFASLLKPYGYTSYFFHGGFNGTMNFDSYAASAGYDKYFGFNEFPDHSQSNGSWGINDEPFLQFVKQKLDSTKQPFHTAVFTLSSHHPFTVPLAYKNAFPKGKHPIVQTIYYTDNALRKFFEAASKTDWYNNTVFLFCADHTGPYQQKTGWNEMRYYHIFSMLYAPGKNLNGIYNKVVQQTDFLPGILSYLNWSGDFVGFGQSPFDSTAKRVSVHYLSPFHSLIDSTSFVQYMMFQGGRIYNYRTDPDLVIERSQFNQPGDLEKQFLLRTIIRNYRYRLEQNMLTAKLKPPVNQ